LIVAANSANKTLSLSVLIDPVRPYAHNSPSVSNELRRPLIYKFVHFANVHRR
jgi:hypothetical protein